jgi:hypothetical protein
MTSKEDRVPIHRFLRENWYRDVWLLVITVLVGLAILFGLTANRHRIDDVQKERARATFVNCLDQNARHDQALKRLERSRLTRDAKAFVTGYTDDIAPKRDCSKVLARAVPSKADK